MARPVLLRRVHATDSPDFARNDFNTMLSRLFGGAIAGDGNDGSLAHLSGFGVDIREDADHVYIDADLPGFRKENVGIQLENGTITITAEKNEEVAEPQDNQPNNQEKSTSLKKEDYLLRERRIQRYVRSFTLPQNVNEQDVQAKLENGVLRITLNKRDESKPKRIQVS